MHCCNSTNGSSGGPLINLKNNKVIGIHKGYNGKINLGILLREPIEIFCEQANKINNVQTNRDANNNMEPKIKVSTDNIIVTSYFSFVNVFLESSIVIFYFFFSLFKLIAIFLFGIISFSPIT